MAYPIEAPFGGDTYALLSCCAGCRKRYDGNDSEWTVTMTTASTWGGWQAVSLRCLGCKHHYLQGTANMCACASRTLMRTQYGDECASYCPKGVSYD